MDRPSAADPHVVEQIRSHPEPESAPTQDQSGNSPLYVPKTEQCCLTMIGSDAPENSNIREARESQEELNRGVLQFLDDEEQLNTQDQLLESARSQPAEPNVDIEEQLGAQNQFQQSVSSQPAESNVDSEEQLSIQDQFQQSVTSQPAEPNVDSEEQLSIRDQFQQSVSSQPAEPNVDCEEQLSIRYQFQQSVRSQPTEPNVDIEEQLGTQDQFQQSVNSQPTEPNVDCKGHLTVQDQPLDEISSQPTKPNVDRKGHLSVQYQHMDDVKSQPTDPSMNIKEQLGIQEKLLRDLSAKLKQLQHYCSKWNRDVPQFLDDEKRLNTQDQLLESARSQPIEPNVDIEEQLGAQNQFQQSVSSQPAESSVDSEEQLSIQDQFQQSVSSQPAEPNVDSKEQLSIRDQFQQSVSSQPAEPSVDIEEQLSIRYQFQQSVTSQPTKSNVDSEEQLSIQDQFQQSVSSRPAEPNVDIEEQLSIQDQFQQRVSSQPAEPNVDSEEQLSIQDQFQQSVSSQPTESNVTSEDHMSVQYQQMDDVNSQPTDPSMNIKEQFIIQDKLLRDLSAKLMQLQQYCSNWARTGYLVKHPNEPYDDLCHKNMSTKIVQSTFGQTDSLFESDLDPGQTAGQDDDDLSSGQITCSSTSSLQLEDSTHLSLKLTLTLRKSTLEQMESSLEAEKEPAQTAVQNEDELAHDSNSWIISSSHINMRLGISRYERLEYWRKWLKDTARQLRKHERQREKQRAKQREKLREEQRGEQREEEQQEEQRDEEREEARRDEEQREEKQPGEQREKKQREEQREEEQREEQREEELREDKREEEQQGEQREEEPRKEQREEEQQGGQHEKQQEDEQREEKREEERERQFFWLGVKDYTLRRRWQRRQSEDDNRHQGGGTGDLEPQPHLALESINSKPQRTSSWNYLAWLVSHFSPWDCDPVPKARRIHRSQSTVMLTARERHLVGLMDLMVEVAFPSCAICQLNDEDASDNADVMSDLHSGEEYREECGECLIAGSQAEGLALESGWGHRPPDKDSMRLIGGRLGVYIPGGNAPRGAASLEYHPEGCPPAYCKLQVTDRPTLRQGLSRYTNNWRKEHIQVRRCSHRVGEHHWLDTYNTVRLMKDSDDTVSGPAAQSGLEETITTLVCSAPHPDLQRKFIHRSRQQWPPAQVIEDILQLPMLLVLVGHKLSKDVNREARISWSHCEMKIMQTLSKRVRQGYIACKYVLKYFLAVHRDPNLSGDGRSHVGSFHIKTAFLHYLEKKPPTMITSPFGLFIDLLHHLDHYLEVGKLPHYFLSECDLLETVDCEERRIARQAIRGILSDPLAATLTSPTCPSDVYGEVQPDALVNSFRRVVHHPIYERSYKYLSILLARVDEYRHKRYQNQWSDDELTGLVEALKRIKKN